MKLLLSACHRFLGLSRFCPSRSSMSVVCSARCRILKFYGFNLFLTLCPFNIYSPDYCRSPEQQPWMRTIQQSEKITFDNKGNRRYGEGATLDELLQRDCRKKRIRAVNGKLCCSWTAERNRPKGKNGHWIFYWSVSGRELQILPRFEMKSIGN